MYWGCKNAVYHCLVIICRIKCNMRDKVYYKQSKYVREYFSDFDNAYLIFLISEYNKRGQEY